MFGLCVQVTGAKVPLRTTEAKRHEAAWREQGNGTATTIVSDIDTQRAHCVTGINGMLPVLLGIASSESSDYSEPLHSRAAGLAVTNAHKHLTPTSGKRRIQ